MESERARARERKAARGRRVLLLERSREAEGCRVSGLRSLLSANGEADGDWHAEMCGSLTSRMREAVARCRRDATVNRTHAAPAGREPRKTANARTADAATLPLLFILSPYIVLWWSCCFF